ncbi:PD-(D/E)XK nuclease family protein [Cetobacterium sp. SF1]|uniref:PD-(D/E)XK nuclease family protein n=1 Tax=Cetobacterium sp. SF1 TaxID=3417654 RepID=UPI003CF2E8AA
MEFKYIEYGKDITLTLREDMETIYVFSDYFLKNNYKKNLKKNIFKGVPTIFTFEEFKEKIFETEKVILREAKRFISFYNGNKELLKELLNMDSYYDIIDYGDSFFKYYKEMNEAMIGRIKNPQPWQMKYIENFEVLKKNYDEYLRHRNHELMDWIPRKENIKLDFVKKYKKIIFIDIMDFKPLEKEVIKRLEKILDVEFILQISPEDYDQENLTIKNVNLPKINLDVEVYEVKEEMEELMILELLKENNPGEIFVGDITKNNYHKILPGVYVPGTKAVLNDTILYKFLKTQYDLVASLEGRLKNKIPLFSLRDALENIEFRNVYGITEENMEEFYNLLENDYKYLNGEVSENFLNLDREIKNIGRFERVDDFVEYFKNNLDLNKFYEGEYKNLFEKFYEAITLAKTSEYMLGEDGFKKCFSNGVEIYKLILQYMNNIEIDRIDAMETKISVAREIQMARGRTSRTFYFTGLSSKNFPGNLGVKSLFSEAQREENNLITKDKNRELLKHRFYQGLFNCRKAIIIYRKNEGKGEDISPFVTELMETYGIKLSKNPVKDEDILENLREMFKGNSLKEENLPEDILEKEIKDFKNGQCRIGAYDYETLEGCPYKFYMSKLAEINPLIREWSPNISMKYLGIYVHSVLEEIIKNTWKDIVSKNNFYLSEDYVEEVLLKHFSFGRDKIPVFLDNYFKEILIPRFKGNILALYRDLGKIYGDRKIRRFESEKVNWENRSPIIEDEINFYITGRVDFILESLQENLILDFKTGKKQDKQLDFYSILLYGDETKATKGIYNVFSGDLEFSDRIVLTKDELKNTIMNFIGRKDYPLSETKGICTYCEYKNICRRKF